MTSRFIHSDVVNELLANFPKNKLSSAQYKIIRWRLRDKSEVIFWNNGVILYKSKSLFFLNWVNNNIMQRGCTFFFEYYKEHTKPMPGVSAIRNSVLSYKIMKILFK